MRAVGAVSLGLVFSSLVGAAWAGEVCARAQDLTALQVASVQQHLMVAALACNDAGLYNTFVVTYRDDLQTSDATLKAFFARLGETTGRSEYDAFKTKLANDYSLNSNRNKAFCHTALSVFRAALNEKKTTLASFALSQPMSVDLAYATCGDKVDGGVMAMPILATEPPRITTLANKQDESLSNIVTAQDETAPPAATSSQTSDTAPSGPDATRTFASQDNRQQSYSQQTPSRSYRYPARNPYAVYPYTGNPYARAYGDDPYYRNPYDRYWYGRVPAPFYPRRY
jgi:hypothetical protein